MKVTEVIKRNLLLGALVSALLGCTAIQNSSPQPRIPSLPDGVDFIAKSAENSDRVTIPYTKYRLDNGLTLVLHQDNSDPLVHVDVTYHVGSAREEPGKSGFAHFFEHMMFQGSKHVADEEHFKIVTEAGGSLNGTTSSDITNYYQTVPANQLEKILWLEADRMGFLLDAVTQQKFEVQRDTVKNERAQNYDNAPYGLRAEKNAEALYPPGHPYSWSTIGYVEDLDRVAVTDLKAFFQRWYGPNNATLTIGGDINVAQVIDWVKQYFGTIPSGPRVTSAEKRPVELQADQYVTLEDQVYLPLVQLTFPTVQARHPDEAPLDVLSDILGRGKTSLFYKNLVKDNHAVQTLVSHPCRELACEFQLVALANPAKSNKLADLKKRIDETLLEFETRGVSLDDLNRTKASIESSTIFGLQSVAGKVSTLASNQVFEDEPDLVQYDLDRYNNVSAADVMRVYRKYIKNKAKVVMSIVPSGQTDLAAKPANFDLKERYIPAQAPVSSAPVTAIEDAFDRSKQPVAGPNPAVQVPAFWSQDFSNGLKMLGHTTIEAPTVTLVLSIEGGPILESKDKAGLASVTAQMMNESTLSMSNEEMSNQLALLGSRISFSASGRFTEIRVSSLSKNLDKTLSLLRQKLFEPAFLEEDLNRLKQRLSQSLQQQQKNPSALASRAVDQLLYGEDNRQSVSDIGTLASIQTISIDDVKQFYRSYYTPRQANLVVAGDISAKQAAEKVAFLTEWQGPSYTLPDVQGAVTFAQPTIYLVDKPDAAQSIVRIFKPYLPYDATGEQFKSKLMNFALGGSFNSRINLNLREDKGYTYGAFSGFSGGKTLGRFEAGADLTTQHTAEGIRELLSEINTFHESGIRPDELIFMRKAYTQSEALNYETPYSKLAFLRRLMIFDLDTSYVDEQLTIINSISAQDIARIAAKSLDTDSMQIVVVGDAAKVLSDLESIGRPVVQIDIQL